MPGRPVPQVTDATRPYWEAARESRLSLPKCGACGDVFFPPRQKCPACRSDQIAWITASGEAEIVSFSAVHMQPFEGYADHFPYVLAIVRLAEGPQLMTNIVDCDVDALRIGDGVSVCFEARGDGARIPQFRPGRAINSNQNGDVS
ncbi:Zn-ribbon domain-containing OB-fold protein [Devosia sp. FKR38]|uniref:Zn-ribbon domain-containing OB-fold protein n=1 Tax=Devosia sp. FKR38 TaxID=2562312 RepID=UPI0010C05335|nr:Zn-ribbon domain-containing OB-fold protein [Devosia sp. FKR38]